MEQHGVDTRIVWTGNVLGQPAFKQIGAPCADGGFPNADRVMEHRGRDAMSPWIDDDDAHDITDAALAFVGKRNAGSPA